MYLRLISARFLFAFRNKYNCRSDILSGDVCQPLNAPDLRDDGCNRFGNHAPPVAAQLHQPPYRRARVKPSLIQGRLSNSHAGLREELYDQ